MKTMGSGMARHKTAIRRRDASRPIRLAIEDGLLEPGMSVFDYGCGHGADILVLRKLGFEADGWDPTHRASVSAKPADVVNLGFVVNVIEDPRERCSVLKAAWDLARRVMVVAARLISERRDSGGEAYADGVVTNRGTFQKFYNQDELRNWIERVLDNAPVAAGPGVFYVFRDASHRARFLHERQRSRRIIPRVFRAEVLFERHRDLLEPLMQFWRERGRLPDRLEWPDLPRVRDAFGSLRKAFQVVVSTTDAAAWEAIRNDRKDDLLVYLALAKFSKRPRRGELPAEMWYDVKEFWGSYKEACSRADELLFSLGNEEALVTALGQAPVGKIQDNAVYLHVDEVCNLTPLLRIYEGCAKAYIGEVEEANVVKLHRRKPAVTYMAYDRFDSDPYPKLLYSLRIELHTFRLKERFFHAWESPPILHEKSSLIGDNHPLKKRSDRLANAERRLGIDVYRQEANDLLTWQSVLKAFGLEHRGHTLIRV